MPEGAPPPEKLPAPRPRRAGAKLDRHVAGVAGRPRWRHVVRRARAVLASLPFCARGSDFAQRYARAWRDDRLGGLAAEVAFFGLLSVFPALIALAAALAAMEGLFGGDVAVRAQQRVIGVLETFLTDRAQGTIEGVQALFREGSGGAFTIGALGAVWAASRGTAAVLRALSEIADIGASRSNLFTRLRGLALAVGTLLVVAAMLATLVLGPLFGLGRLLAAKIGVEDVYSTAWEWLGVPVAFVVLLAWAGAVLHLAPHRHVSWRQDLLASATTGLLWLAISLGFRLYLELFGGNPVFGVLGGALAVLLWLYLLSLALLMGAELNAVLAESREEDRRVPEPAGACDVRASGTNARIDRTIETGSRVRR